MNAKTSIIAISALLLTLITGAAPAAAQTLHAVATAHSAVGAGGALDAVAIAQRAAAAQQAAQEAAQQAEEQRLEQERIYAEQQALAAAQAPAQPSQTQVEIALETVATLPNAEGITVTFDNPELQGHTGSVWITQDPSRASNIMITSSRIEQYGTGKDVALHEAFHVYQNRAIASLVNENTSWLEAKGILTQRLDAAYGAGNGMEYAADCGALFLGATSTYYTQACAGTEHISQALINGSGEW